MSLTMVHLGFDIHNPGWPLGQGHGENVLSQVYAMYRSTRTMTTVRIIRNTIMTTISWRCLWSYFIHSLSGPVAGTCYCIYSAIFKWCSQTLCLKQLSQGEEGIQTMDQAPQTFIPMLSSFTRDLFFLFWILKICIKITSQKGSVIYWWGLKTTWHLL